jgi:iron complex transport system ATP-binding protein
MTAAGSTVRAEGVTVELGGRTVLDAVSLRVEPGELVAVIGPNGAGKSTLLAALAGDVPLQAGSVRLGGLDVASSPPRDLARLRAVMPQDHTIAFPFPVADVVGMARAPWARTPHEDEDDDAVAAALAAAGVTHLADRPMPSLSGGERARVTFARALAQRTGTLLLDEPTASLDIGHQEDVLTESRRLADDGWTVVVVLHDLTLAAAYADRIALLADGRLVAVGEPDEVLTADRVSEVYGHPVVVVPDPLTGAALIVPDRRGRVRR